MNAKEYNKNECFVKDLPEDEDEDDGELGIPAFIKRKMEK